jgi:hypothetical protein
VCTTYSSTHEIAHSSYRDDAKIKSHKPGWVLKHVRAGQEVFKAEVERAGFRLVSEPVVPGMEENYVMIFEKRGMTE